MKILEISSDGYAAGGIENNLILTRDQLVKMGHVVKVFSSNAHPDKPRFSDYEYQVPTNKLGYIFNINAYRQLKRVIKEYQPDVINVHSVGHASPSIFFAMKGCAVVNTIHGPDGYTKSLLEWILPTSDFKNGEQQLSNLRLVGWLRYCFYRYVMGFIYIFAFRNVDRFLVLSTYMHELMEKEGITNEKVRYASILYKHMPLPVENIPHTLLYTGRLRGFKGVDFLIRALPQILAQYPDTHLEIAGRGESRESLEKLVAMLGLEQHVTFLGFINRAELEKSYQAASIVVVPSVWPEAFGLIGPEAMSVGRPVVATNVGGISDWLDDGVTGIQVPPRDSDAIAQAVTRLFSDPKLLVRMGENGWAAAQDYTVEKYARRLEKIYTDLIKQKGRV